MLPGDDAQSFGTVHLCAAQFLFPHMASSIVERALSVYVQVCWLKAAQQVELCVEPPTNLVRERSQKRNLRTNKHYMKVATNQQLNLNIIFIKFVPSLVRSFELCIAFGKFQINQAFNQCMIIQCHQQDTDDRIK